MEGNVSDLMGMFAEFRHNLQQLEEKLQQLAIDAEAGGGLVKATVNGRLQLIRLEIDPSILQADQKQMVEDLIVAAVNLAQQKAVEKVQEVSAEQLGAFGMLQSMLFPK